jgi:hypothetical protein
LASAQPSTLTDATVHAIAIAVGHTGATAAVGDAQPSLIVSDSQSAATAGLAVAPADRRAAISDAIALAFGGARGGGRGGCARE